MNAPDRFDAFQVPEGEQKIRFVKDGKVANAGTFVIRAEDHTIGNLVRTQMLKNNKVLFVGYRIPHPLEPYVEIRVQTTSDTTPQQELVKELDNLVNLTRKVAKNFKDEATRFGFSNMDAGDFGMNRDMYDDYM